MEVHPPRWYIHIQHVAHRETQHVQFSRRRLAQLPIKAVYTGGFMCGNETWKLPHSALPFRFKRKQPFPHPPLNIGPLLLTSQPFQLYHFWMCLSVNAEDWVSSYWINAYSLYNYCSHVDYNVDFYLLLNAILSTFQSHYFEQDLLYVPIFPINSVTKRMPQCERP